MDNTSVTRTGLGAAVTATWNTHGIGVPDMLAFGDRLFLPVYRPHTSTPEPVLVELRLTAGPYLATVADEDVLTAAYRTDAEDQIVSRYDAVTLHPELECGSPAHLAVESYDFTTFAREVFHLWQCAQAVLDFADGYESGQAYSEIDVRRERMRKKEQAARRAFAMPPQIRVVGGGR